MQQHFSIQNTGFAWWKWLTWFVLSERELRRDLLRVTMTEAFCSSGALSRGPALWLHPSPSACSLPGDSRSTRLTGTDTGITSGTRPSSRGRLALTESPSAGAFSSAPCKQQQQKDKGLCLKGPLGMGMKHQRYLN